MSMRYSHQALVLTALLGLTCRVAAQSDNGSEGKASLNAADTEFIENAAKDGMAEVQLGQLAVGKSRDEQVKAFAQRIVDDHAKADDALKTLAESKKISFPTSATKEAQKEHDKLQAIKGRGFDQVWSKAMVQHHQDAIKLFAKEGEQSKDTDIQQFVKTTLPALKSHLQGAQQLAAVPDARDKAMDEATKSMNSAMDAMPAAASTAAAKAPAAMTTAPTTPPTAAGARH